MKKIFTSLVFSLSATGAYGFTGRPPKPEAPEVPAGVKISSLYKESQPGRGVPKAAFVDELYEIFLRMPDSAFEANSRADIYSIIAPKLGPWRGITHRRSAAFEAAVSLAGRESTWNWLAGRDTSANNTSAETQESGAFQTSCDARDKEPRALAMMKGITCKQYIPKAKSDHEWTTLFSWYVLRGTKNHHGPVKRGEILPAIQKSRVDALEEIFKKAGK